MAGKQKNFQINELLLAQLKQFEEDSAKRGINLTGAQVVNGALVAFFGLNERDRYDLIARGRNIDLHTALGDADAELCQDVDKTLSGDADAQTKKALKAKHRRNN